MIILQYFSLQVLSNDSKSSTMWQTSILMHYEDFPLSDERRGILMMNTERMRDSLKVSTNECYVIDDTVGQSASIRWQRERMLPITASNCKNIYSFGAKILRGVGNEILNSMYQHIHKQLWYPNQIQTKDMLYGIQEEGNARKLYISGNDVETGMWVNDSYPFLASSPDGIILDSDKVPVGNLEIKCLKVMKEISVDDLIKNIEENKICS